MASNTYNSYLKGILDGSTDLVNDTLKLSLHTSSYTPALTHNFYDDITNEVGASGSYSAGGETLAGVTTTQDDVDNEGVFDATDVAFTSATITARYAVIYKDTAGASSTDPLILYIDFVTDQTSTGGTFTIAFASEGILNIG